jgi:lipopolysaccharide export system protein LptC
MDNVNSCNELYILNYIGNTSEWTISAKNSWITSKKRVLLLHNDVIAELCKVKVPNSVTNLVRHLYLSGMWSGVAPRTNIKKTHV